MSIEKNQIYRCMHCGLLVETVSDGGAVPVCCGEEMKLLKANDSDGAKEKHVPVASPCQKCGGTVVKVGSEPHPMEEDHYIEFIEIINGPYVNRKYLKPGEKPEAEFYVSLQPGMEIREFCNKHGLWKSKQ